MVVAGFLAGGLVKGLVGGGLPTTTVPILAIVLDPAHAAAVTVLPVLATNLWQAFDGRLFVQVLRRFWSYLAAIAAGVVVGSQVLTGLPPRTAALLIGIAVVVLSPLPLAGGRFRVSPRREKLLNPLAGGILGLVGGATVVFSPMLVWLTALRIDKNMLVATAGCMAICCMVPLYLGLGFSASLDGAALRVSVVMLVPTLAGYLVGRALRGAVSQRAFRLILAGSLVLIGLGLVAKGLGGRLV